MKRLFKNKLSLFVSILVPISVYLYCHLSLFSSDLTNDESTKRKWNVSSNIVKFIAGEFKGLMSDFILLEAGALYGTEVKRIKGGRYISINSKPDLVAINRLLSHSLSLDPYFQQIYISAQGWLPWYGEKYVKKTNRLLEIAGKARTWDWQPLHLEGFNNYYFLKDKGRAGKLFLKAGQVKNAPSFLGILGGRLALEGHETEAAIFLLKSVLKGKSETDPGTSELLDRLKALEGVLALEKSVKQYKDRYGSFPDTLNDLVQKGLLKQIPDNPYGLSYCINSEAKIFFDNPECNVKK